MSSEKSRATEIWLSIFDTSERFFLESGVRTESTTSKVSGALSRMSAMRRRSERVGYSHDCRLDEAVVYDLKNHPGQRFLLVVPELDG